MFFGLSFFSFHSFIFVVLCFSTSSPFIPQGISFFSTYLRTYFANVCCLCRQRTSATSLCYCPVTILSCPRCAARRYFAVRCKCLVGARNKIIDLVYGNCRKSDHVVGFSILFFSAPSQIQQTTRPASLVTAQKGGEDGVHESHARTAQSQQTCRAFSVAGGLGVDGRAPLFCLF